MNQPPGLSFPASGPAGGNANTSAPAPPPGLSGAPPGLGAGGGGAAGGGNAGAGVATIVKAQVTFLLQGLTEENFDRSSTEIRTLAAQHGTDIYNHYLRRLVVSAAPVLSALNAQAQSLSQPAPPPGLQAGKAPTGLAAFAYPGDRPLKSALNVPTTGAGVLAWRLLESETRRACRDASLAPYYASALLVPTPPSNTPLVTLNLFSLPAPAQFSFACGLLASPAVRNAQIPPPVQDGGRAIRDRAIGMYRGTVDEAIQALRDGRAWWPAERNGQPQDLTANDGQAIIMASYPLASDEQRGQQGSASTPAYTPPTDSILREQLLQILTHRLSSPAVVLQALPYLAPGGTPSAPLVSLADMLFELGEGLTSDEGIVKDVASRWLGALLAARGRQKDDWEGDDDDKEVEDAVFKTVNALLTGLSNGRRVDSQGVPRGMAAVAPLDWAWVVETFDRAPTALENSLQNPDALALLGGVLTSGADNLAAVNGLFDVEWRNSGVLLRVIDALTGSSGPGPSLASIPALSGSRLLTYEDAQDIPAHNIIGSAWNCLKVWETCARIEKAGDGEIKARATDLLQRGAEMMPDLALMGLAQVSQPWSPVHEQLLIQKLERYLDNPSPLAGPVMSVVGRAMPDRLLDHLRKLYAASELNVGRIVDAAGDGQVLEALLRLDSDEMSLPLDVAAMASRRELIDLETWLAEGINTKGESFIHATLDFLDHKIHAEGARAEEEHVEATPLTPATYATFFKSLRGSDLLAPADIEHFKEIRNYCLQIHPRLMNLGPNSEGEPGLSVVQFPPDIDSQVDEFYQRMYAEDISLDHVIDVFRALKNSEVPRDHELFACMLHTLFDEYKFVHTYPPRELAMTGVLFGSIIQNRLIERTPLHVAVRYVLDALETPPDSSMFTFGKNALAIFQSRLPEFPHMCRALLQIPYLHETNPLLISIIRTAMTEGGNEDDASEAEPVVFSAIQVEELDGDIDAPAEDVSDKILFIINNLSPINFESKIEELRSRWDERYSRWFANYLVQTRVSVEPNNHQLYARLLDALSTSSLEQFVLWETYSRSATLLNTEKTMTESSDRTTLKNLGSWLGRLTVARDTPVKHRNLSIKDLLLQGYDAKRLLVALPFACKIMEQCAPSRVFHPPNPWLMAVLRFMAELYLFGDLKLNLKFEIEVLCKALNVTLDTLEPTRILRSRTPPQQAAQPGSLTQELERMTLSGGIAGPPLGRGPMQTEAAQQASQDAFMRRVDELIAQLPQYMVFSPAYPLFASNPAFKRIALHAIERAVREIINPVVERSVTIAGISSRDLLMKDFGMEGDDGKLRQAAHLMVQKLAGSLALVTCKEPLRTSMMNNIRISMQQSGFGEDSIPEQAIAGIVQDNLEVACAVIKNAAQERAGKDIDVNLASAYAARRRSRETGQPFWDPSAFTTTVAHSALPESLRLTTQGLQPAQLRVYEDFGDQSRFAMQASQMNSIADGEQQGDALDLRARTGGFVRPDPANLPPLGEVVESSILGAKLTVAQSMEKFQEMIAELDKILLRVPVDGLASLPINHDVKMIIRQIPVIATQSANTDQTALAFSQKVVQLLYKSEAALSRDVYVTILQRLCDLFPKVAKEVTQWLIYAEDIRKYNVTVNVALIRAGLINVPEQDMQMAKVIVRDFAQVALNFTADLIRECILSENPCVSRNQFGHALEALVRATTLRRATPAVERLLEDLQARSALRSAPTSERSGTAVSPRPVSIPPPIDVELRGTLTLYFLEWVRLFTSPMPVEASFVPFVNRLQKQGILRGEEVSSAFYRNSIALALDIYAKNAPSGSPQMFHGVDALSKLIALLLKNYADTHGVSSDSAKTLYFAKIFTIAALSLVHDHEEMGANFEQRPYHRFFSSLLSDLQCIQSSFPTAYYGCLRTFANHLGSIQPSIAPSFAYSWMSLISHRFFMPRLLTNKEGWADFYRVLMALFKFLNPFLQSADLHSPSRLVFKGALRILLVILKDFPEFLVEHYIGLCAAIPAHCIQLRNVVLCAFPRGVVVRQDVETLADLPPMPEFQEVPEVRTDYVRFLEEAQVKGPIDEFLQRGDGLQYLLPELRNRIAISVTSPDGTPGVTYNLTLLYSLVLYLGVVAVERQISRNGQVTFDPSMAEVNLLTSIVAGLDAEGQYHFVNAVCNQLRYPNAHTFFFMLYLLQLFSTCPPTSSVPERIARVLLERVLAQRPHPFGLTLTMTTLLREPKFGFFEWPWARRENSPELWALFQRCAAGAGKPPAST